MEHKKNINVENKIFSQKDKTVIKICNLTKRYGTKKAVDNISLTVNCGEILGFLGPNGAGKSTTMNILTGYISSTSGKVLIDGSDILENPKIAKKKIGYLPENPPLYNDMSVNEYLEFVYELKKVEIPRKEHLSEIMETVKIDHVADRMIKNLSKGYKQRVGLAQALVGNPEVLILDEPTVGLDPKQIMEIRDVIRIIGQNRTVILSTHILQEVSAVCDRIAIINQGKIAAVGNLPEITETFGDKGKYLIRAVGNVDDIKLILEKIAGLKDFKQLATCEQGTVDFSLKFKTGEDFRPSVFKAFADAGIVLVEFKSLELSLEEIFMRVITETKIEEKGEAKNEGDI